MSMNGMVSKEIENKENAGVPEVMYFGTSTSKLRNILEDGIKPRKDLLVSLNSESSRARYLGKILGTLALIKVNAKAMIEDGFEFASIYEGTFFVKEVPAKYIENVCVQSHALIQ